MEYRIKTVTLENGEEKVYIQQGETGFQKILVSLFAPDNLWRTIQLVQPLVAGQQNTEGMLNVLYIRQAIKYLEEKGKEVKSITYSK